MATLADLDKLKARLGVRGSASDAQLSDCIDAAIAQFKADTYPDPVGDEYWRLTADGQQWVFMASGRLFARINTPEGVAGFNDLGAIRIIATDPDLVRLKARHIDYAKVGVA